VRGNFNSSGRTENRLKEEINFGSRIKGATRYAKAHIGSPKGFQLAEIPHNAVVIH